MPLQKLDPSLDDHTPVTSAPSAGSLSPVDRRERIGRYRIDRLLGSGGMGSVYLAFDTHLGREVALKIPHFGPHQAGLMERFFREARAAGRLHHPNICQVYDVGESDGVHYLCMEYVEGETLAGRVERLAARPPREAAALVRKIALALDEAHAKGVIHRDLKPLNVMIDRKGEPVVMDFGLAREISSSGDSSKTSPGVVMGTPAYMSPEQARGDAAAVGPGCDVYSLGVVLYELLAGRTPFTGHTLEVIAQQLRDEPPPLSSLRPDLDARLESICQKAMAKEPSRRFLSMGEFAQSLQEYIDGADAVTVIDDPDPIEQAASEALVLMRTWGWEAGVARFESGGGWYESLESAQLLRKWLRGDESVTALAQERFRGLRQFDPLAGWVLLGRVWVANRYHHFDRADALLREAAKAAGSRDNVLQAAVGHQRGFWLYQTGKLNDALAALHEALDLCGHDHFLTADILNSMSLVYANKNNFQAAHEFIQQALLVHRRFGNDRIVARCLRTLGELYLDWGELERAEEVLQRGLQRGVKTQDERVQAIMCHYLGRVGLGKGLRTLGAGQKALGRQELTKAGQWLDASIRAEKALGRRYSEAASQRDRALVCLAQDDLAGAATHAESAEALFRGSPHDHSPAAADHEEGLARTWQVQGMIARRREDHAEAQRLLRRALTHFDRIADFLEGTRTQLELARTLDAAGAIPQVVTAAYLDALGRAETCRRTHLVRAIEDEVRALDLEAHGKHVFGRVRGRSALADTSSLADGTNEVVSVLFLNLQGFMPFCQGMEPEEVMRTLNHLLADLAEPLGRADAQVTAHLGGGFMALVRGPGHAWRAVDASLELIAVVEEFNRPRAVLGLQQLPVRVAVASGPACLGNVGTYQKMDFTAIGNTVNLAARLVRQAQTRQPCVSRETRQLVGERFGYAANNPRALDLGPLGRHEVWDVTGRRQGLMSGPQG